MDSPVKPLNAIRCPCCGAPTSAGSATAPETALSIVIPVFNEAEQIGNNLQTIRLHCLETGLPFELVAIDDGSNDETWKRLTELGNTLPELGAIQLSRNFGKEAAICAGLSSASGRACIVIDSDLQHPPQMIPAMVRLWQNEGWQVVEATKVTRGKEPLANRLGAKFFYRTISYLSGFPLDGASDFQLLDRRVVTAYLEMQERNTFFRGMSKWLGYRRVQLPFEVPERLIGKSRFSLIGLARLASVALTAFSSLPLQIVTVLGGLFLIGSLILTVDSLWMYFSGRARAGFTTVILLQLMIGGVLMLSLGIIGTYLGRVYDETKARPRFVIADTLLRHSKQAGSSRDIAV